MCPINQSGGYTTQHNATQSVKSAHFEYYPANISFLCAHCFEYVEMILFLNDNHPDTSDKIEGDQNDGENNDDVSDPFLNIHQLVQVFILLVLVLNPDRLFRKNRC